MRLNGTEQGLVAYYPFEKKTLDAYNQVVTEGTDDDMLRTDHKAVYADALTFTDEAPALREKKTETNVDYSFTASDNKIVITLNETPASIAHVRSTSPSATCATSTAISRCPYAGVHTSTTMSWHGARTL